jgi:hypothetical protein
MCFLPCPLTACASNRLAFKENNVSTAAFYLDVGSKDCLQWADCVTFAKQLPLTALSRGVTLNYIQTQWTGSRGMIEFGGAPNVEDAQVDFAKLGDPKAKYIVVMYPFGFVITTNSGPAAHVMYLTEELELVLAARVYDAKTHDLIQSTYYHKQMAGYDGNEMNTLIDEVAGDLWK